MVQSYDEQTSQDATWDYDKDTLRKMFCTRTDGDLHTEVYAGKYRNWVFIAPRSDSLDMPKSAREDIQYCDWYVKSFNDDGTFRLYGFCKVRNPKKQSTMERYFPEKLELMPCTLYRVKTSGYKPFSHLPHFSYGLSTNKEYRSLVSGVLEDDIEFNLNPVNRFFGFIRPVSKVKLTRGHLLQQVPPILDDPLPDPDSDYLLPHFTAYARGLELSSSSPPLSPEPSAQLPPEPPLPPKKRFYSIEICRLEDLYKSDDETDVYSSEQEEAVRLLEDELFPPKKLRNKRGRFT